MRLTCPNCDAKYEVPDEVVPVAGRDVQCSNCGQTWFQHHPDHAPQEDMGLDLGAPADDEEVAPPPPRPGKEPERRQLDPAVADILRQEAEAEFEARRARQSGGLETQPDLGLTESDPEPEPQPAPEENADQRALEAKKRMARMRGEAEPAAAAGGAALGSRRELLPDIEEINSTLRSESGRGSRDADVHSDAERSGSKRRSGFRRGFMLVMLILALMALVYVYAPQIAANLPQADPYLSAYVTWVDQMRIWLDGQVQAGLTWLDSMASQSGE